MTRRDVLVLAAPAFVEPFSLAAAPCVSSLDPRTASDYDPYLKTAREKEEQPLGSNLLERLPDDQRAAAERVLASGQPYIWNLHQNRPNGALPVYKGVIVDWMGAMRMPGASLAAFEKALSRYDSYKDWYKPYIFGCYARPVDGPGEKNFEVTSIIHDVYEKSGPLVPELNFSFEVKAKSSYFRNGNTLVIRTHANSIREAADGRPEHADSRSENNLLPAGRGQGVLWRSDTWWRATERDSELYAEYESLSLARSLDAVEFFSLCTALRLPGLRGKVLESMTVRPRKTVTAILVGTRKAVSQVA